MRVVGTRPDSCFVLSGTRLFGVASLDSDPVRAREGMPLFEVNRAGAGRVCVIAGDRHRSGGAVRCGRVLRRGTAGPCSTRRRWSDSGLPKRHHGAAGRALRCGGTAGDDRIQPPRGQREDFGAAVGRVEATRRRQLWHPARRRDAACGRVRNARRSSSTPTARYRMPTPCRRIGPERMLISGHADGSVRIWCVAVPHTSTAGRQRSRANSARHSGTQATPRCASSRRCKPAEMRLYSAHCRTCPLSQCARTGSFNCTRSTTTAVGSSSRS